MIFEYTPDADQKIDRRNAIRLLAREFASHEAGLPEWVKNSSDAYVRSNTQERERIILVVLDDSRRDVQSSISCIDFVGMTAGQIDRYFRIWAAPDAAGQGASFDGLQGGHGNGGKSYMTQMFEDYAYLHTVREGRGNKYGVRADDRFLFGYIPTPREGRDFLVADKLAEFDRACHDIRLSHSGLPGEIRSVLERSPGFTLVRGVKPRGYQTRFRVKELVDAIVGHPQMIETMMMCRVFVVSNGEFIDGDHPLALPEIVPLEGAPLPRVVDIPEHLPDRMSGQMVSTTEGGKCGSGKLTIRTSEKSMRWKPRIYLHVIQCKAASGFVGTIQMRELSTSHYGDHMFGECRLDSLEAFRRNDRNGLSESPLTRALRDWIAQQIDLYAVEFEKLEKLRMRQEDKDALSGMNAALDKWKNQFLEDLLSGSGDGPGSTPRPGTSLPSGVPARMELIAWHRRAGLRVTFRPILRFYDEENKRIRPVPFRLISEDNNVAAVVDENLMVIETFSVGETAIHAETLDGRLKSNRIPLEVVHLHRIQITPEQVELRAGSRSKLEAKCTLASGEQTSDVFLEWIENDRSIANVSAAGMVFGFTPGETTVEAADDRVTCESPATIRVLEPEPGVGKGYPRILLSDIDPDPQTGEPARLNKRDPPVHQRVEDADRNIWWINMSSPLARRYYSEARGNISASREWRAYHLERYIEALVKIQLVHKNKQGEQMDFEQWLNLWDETAVKMQENAAETLRAFLDEGTLPESDT